MVSPICGRHSLPAACQAANASEVMPNRIHKFKDTDVKRAIKSALKAGVDVGGVRINPRTGEIDVYLRDKGAAVITNTWDEVIASEQQSATPPPRPQRRIRRR